MFEGFHLPRIGVAEHVAHRFYVHIILYWNSRDDLLSEWLEILHEAMNYLRVPEKDDHVRQIASRCQRAPKVRTLLALVVEYGVKN